MKDGKVTALETRLLRAFQAPKGKHGLPLNVPLQLDDGRMLLVRRGNGQTIVCRQIGKKDEKPVILQEGDTVATVAGRDGRKAVLHVEKRTRKDVHFKILGSVDGAGKPVGPTEAKTTETPQEPGSGSVEALPGATGEQYG